LIWDKRPPCARLFLIQNKPVPLAQPHTARVEASPGGGWGMDWNLIALGLVGWVLIQLGVLILMRMSGDQDRIARREEKRLIPYSDVTLTHYGNG